MRSNGGGVIGLKHKIDFREIAVKYLERILGLWYNRIKLIAKVYKNASLPLEYDMR